MLTIFLHTYTCLRARNVHNAYIDHEIQRLPTAQLIQHMLPESDALAIKNGVQRQHDASGASDASAPAVPYIAVDINSVSLAIVPPGGWDM